MKMTKLLAAASAAALMFSGSQAFGQAATLNAQVEVELVDTCAFTASYTNNTLVVPAESAEINFGQHLVGAIAPDKGLEANATQGQVGATCASTSDPGRVTVSSLRADTVPGNTATVIGTTGTAATNGTTIGYALYQGTVGGATTAFNFSNPDGSGGGSEIEVPADNTIVPVNVWARLNAGAALNYDVGRYEDTLVFAIWQ